MWVTAALPILKEAVAGAAVQKSEDTMNQILRCYAWGRRAEWQAICVDLDIVVQGSSVEEAKDILRACVDDYLDIVAGMPLEEQQHLLHRRSPWGLRAKLAFRAWLPWNRRRDAGPVGFPVRASQPLPA